jgi:predicted transcriptional regulator YdeE
MAITLSEPRVIERGPYLVVGAYCTFEGEDEGPGWSGASEEFYGRREEITNRVDDAVLGFLYRPYRDHPDIPEGVRACFVGVEVADVDHVPEGLSTTRFSGGKYAIVACRGDTESEAAMGVGEGVQFLERWVEEQGCVEGDACFACSHENEPRPPFIEYVYIKMEEHRRQMEPKIASREAFQVMGVVGHFSSAAENFGPLWDEYMAFHDQIESLSVGGGHYGVYLSADHSKPLDYLAGMAVSGPAGAPEGAEVREVPAALYAVFSCSFQDIGSTYGHIWDEWLASSAYEQDMAKLGFDYFPPGMAEGDSRIEVWFAVKRKEC